MKRTVLFIATLAWLLLMHSWDAPAEENSGLLQSNEAGVHEQEESSAEGVELERLIEGSGSFEISWYTIDGGGGTSEGGGFTLLGSIGQPDAGGMAGGSFMLYGGFIQSAPAGSPSCLGDFNNDGVVNASDLALLLGAWGANPGHPADFNDDGVVNASDLALLLGAWGTCE